MGKSKHYTHTHKQLLDTHIHTDLKRKRHVKEEMLQPVQPATYQMTFFLTKY